MRKVEKKGPNFLGRHGPISKFTYSESSPQIRQLGKNRFFVSFFDLICLQDPCGLQCLILLICTTLDKCFMTGKSRLYETLTTAEASIMFLLITLRVTILLLLNSQFPNSEVAMDGGRNQSLS